MRPRPKLVADRSHPVQGAPGRPHEHLVPGPDRLTMLEHQMRAVFQELRVQLTRIAQLQVQLDSTRHALDALAHKPHRR